MHSCKSTNLRLVVSRMSKKAYIYFDKHTFLLLHLNKLFVYKFSSYDDAF